MPVLVHARADERAELDALDAAIAPFAPLEQLDAQGIAELCPLLRTGAGAAVDAIADRDGLRLDPHALLQGFTRRLKARGGTLCTGARVARIERAGARWCVESESGQQWSSPVLLNAAGAWADAVAAMAGIAPIGLRPLRRTIITFDAPDGTDLSRLPFAKTVGDELYFAPESGRLFASPMDEVPDEPCDAQPEEYEVALAAHRMEQRTHVRVDRIHHRWSGLRTFAPDRRPVVGFDPAATGFFWLAGQGGAGLQTSPAMARIAAALIAGQPWPDIGVEAAALSPVRFAKRADIDPA
jgi:D-arginine dehydrogenase